MKLLYGLFLIFALIAAAMAQAPGGGAGGHGGAGAQGGFNMGFGGENDDVREVMAIFK